MLRVGFVFWLNIIEITQIIELFFRLKNIETVNLYRYYRWSATCTGIFI